MKTAPVVRTARTPDKNCTVSGTMIPEDQLIDYSVTPTEENIIYRALQYCIDRDHLFTPVEQGMAEDLMFLIDVGRDANA